MLVICELRSERTEKLRVALVIIGSELMQDLMRLRDDRRKRLLEDLAADGDEAAAQQWFEEFGDVPAQAGLKF